MLWYAMVIHQPVMVIDMVRDGYQPIRYSYQPIETITSLLLTIITIMVITPYKSLQPPINPFNRPIKPP